MGNFDLAVDGAKCSRILTHLPVNQNCTSNLNPPSLLIIFQLIYVRCFVSRLLVLLVLFPAIAHAEVMDKEFSLLTVVLWGLLGTALVFFAARLKPWLLLLALPLVGSFFALQLTEIVDPHVGPAIAAEAGNLYIAVSWVAPALVLAGGCAGYLLRLRNANT